MNAYKQEVYSKIIKVLANVLVLVAVTISMYISSQYPDEAAKVFSMWFFPQVCGILIMALLALRMVRRCFPTDATSELLHASMVELPRLGRKLVRWRVLDLSDRP